MYFSRISPHWTNIFVLGHRMYEAHFLPIHITFLVVGSGLYKLFTPSTQIPSLLLYILDLTGYLRLVTPVSFFIFLYFFLPLRNLPLYLRLLPRN
jgi:hypothetical protein